MTKKNYWNLVFQVAYSKSDLGLSYRDEKIFVFFGNKKAHAEDIQKEFSQFLFLKIKQTHSDILVAAGSEVKEADAHFTEQKNTGLLIATADCMPIMIHCLQTQRVAAVHAGWRGIANQITMKSLEHLVQTGSSQKRFQFFVGPYITQDSFEVSLDAKLILEQSQIGLKPEDYMIKKGEKFLIDLKQILISQISSVIQTEPTILFSNIDTKTDGAFWSFRREKEGAGRNLSFIARL